MRDAFCGSVHVHQYACASIEREFERSMEYLKVLDEKAYEYVKNMPKNNGLSRNLPTRHCLIG